MYKLITLIVIIIFAGVYFSMSPQLIRNWNLDQVILPEAQFNDDNTVTLNNVRNFKYSSTTDYKVNYYDTVVDLNKLERVDYIIEPFGSIGAAHTFLSFGFKDGKQIAISVEIRKEVGESFSPLKGLLRQYELIYVVADEQDVIDLRANHRKHSVYVYPTSANQEQAISLFRSMLDRANSLQVKPEFYNTLTNNCTTNIVRHINTLFNKEISWDHRLLLPEASDTLAKELGFIASDMTIEEARALYLINERADIFKSDPDFSKKIREPYVSASSTSKTSTDVNNN